jgi:nitrogen regulatory protein PII 2
MKEIMAIIRPKKVASTKRALEKLGFPGMTAVAVLGRGRQRGIAGEVSFEIQPESLKRGVARGMKYVPKRLITVIVPDDNVDDVIDEIIQTNQTGTIGDGKIFICPLDNAMRVRTGEKNDAALF